MNWRRQWQPTPVLLPGESHGWRSLVGCSPRGRSESDMTERLHFDFSLPCIGEGNGNPLKCSCLENPRDGGAWWIAVYEVTQSWTLLKRLSSSRSNEVKYSDGCYSKYCIHRHIYLRAIIRYYYFLHDMKNWGSEMMYMSKSTCLLCNGGEFGTQ